MRERRSGILLHPTSLPGPFGIGDLGPAALDLLDWLQSAGQTVWQLLPLGPTAFGASPYNVSSSFAGNPALISPQALVEEGVVAASELAGAPGEGAGLAEAAAWKEELLRRAWEGFGHRVPPSLAGEVAAFAEAPEQRAWLDDWALYAALKRRHGGRPWVAWPRELRERRAEALERARHELAGELGFHVFVQFLFERQFAALRRESRRRGVLLFGDLPIYVAPDSADVWAASHLFDLDADGRPRAVAGVPPDYFSATGQRWGNPLYRWQRIRRDGYRWWIDRVAAALRRVDLLRLDHFRGFTAFWKVPASAETAAEGHWVRGPGGGLFGALRAALGELPLVAEDLGVITPDVRRLMERFDLPGMRVLQFGFDSPDSEHLPHNYPPDCVAYTGTHDNDTALGWFDGLGEESRERAEAYLGTGGEPIHRRLIRCVLASVARISIVPMQDVLGLGSEARMNTPGRPEGNWGWRLAPEALGEPQAAHLRRLVELTGRLPGP